jgi:hypothetical protein
MIRHAAAALMAVCFVPLLSLQAQENSSVDLRATFGMRNGITGDTCSNGGQLMGGGSLRYHVSSRVSVGPEVLFVKQCDQQVFTFYHPQMTGMLHLAVDLGKGRVAPYLLGGAGFVRNRQFNGQSNYRAEFAGGGGAKFFLSDRLFLAPEAQVGGRVSHFRITGAIGIVLGP